MANGKLHRWEYERRGEAMLIDAPGTLTLDEGSLMNIAQARLDRARPREQVFGNRIPNAPQAEFVAGFALLKQRHDPPRALALGFVEINPSK